MGLVILLPSQKPYKLRVYRGFKLVINLVDSIKKTFFSLSNLLYVNQAFFILHPFNI
jgi:hypothetical protein